MYFFMLFSGINIAYYLYKFSMFSIAKSIYGISSYFFKKNSVNIEKDILFLKNVIIEQNKMIHDLHTKIINIENKPLLKNNSSNTEYEMIENIL